MEEAAPPNTNPSQQPRAARTPPRDILGMASTPWSLSVWPGFPDNTTGTVSAGIICNNVASRASSPPLPAP
ncbi:MAG: hypothetical protein HC918_07980 [Oscillatoriales cyanobacterium SM2_1_8]|nr:hypothetical protein [Oscillatoriales cyanobacterium SM2_1_8]